jgi:hypothetical protein
MIMKRLNLPMAPLKLTRIGETIYVHCQVRKKNLVLTPEEWVRQHVIHFLLVHTEVPIGLIATELGMKINKLKRRSDVVVFGRDKSILLLVECKAPEVPIDDKVLHQAAQYNSHVKANYIWLSNGLDHHLYQINHQTGEIKRLEELPRYDEL